MRCSNCRFWVQDPDDETEPGGGQCRRHAPRPIPLSPGSDRGPYLPWPYTLASDFCGEFQPKPLRET